MNIFIHFKNVEDSESSFKQLNRFLEQVDTRSNTFTFTNVEFDSETTIKLKINIPNNYIGNILVNTIKWIDDILDWKLRETNSSFTICLDKCVECKNFINVPTKFGNFINALKSRKDIIINSQNKNILNFKFTFTKGATMKRSKVIKLQTERGEVNFKAIEIDKYLYSVYWIGDLSKGEIPTRVHYQCETSEIFSSKHCDCKQQLDNFLDHIQKVGKGIMIYAHEEGRGNGLVNKVDAYWNTQELGDDTVDAMAKLGVPTENRNFENPARILKELKIKTVILFSNNPLKSNPISEIGIQVINKETWGDIHPEAKEYVETKINRMGHKKIWD